MTATTPEFLGGEPGRPPWLPTSVFPFMTRFADLDGDLIHYLDEGSGPALLLVSAGQWCFMFRDVIMALRGHFRCLTLDFPGSGLSPEAANHDQSVRANARILERFIDSLDLQDLTLIVHDVGGPIGFHVAIRRPERFRALVISNTFGWPLVGYPAVRRMLAFVTSKPLATINNVTNLIARLTATSYGVGKRMNRADRRAFLGPWRSHGSREATRRVLAGVLRIDPMMADIERSLRSGLGDLPVLTLFGRKNDPYGWQDRFQMIFPDATAAGIEGGHHFPFCDHPAAYSARICAWWKTSVAAAGDRPATSGNPSAQPSKESI